MCGVLGLGKRFEGRKAGGLRFINSEILIFLLRKSLCKLKKGLNLHSLNSTAGLWCNGNTTVFGAVFLGSSPSRPT